MVDPAATESLPAELVPAGLLLVDERGGCAGADGSSAGVDGSAGFGCGVSFLTGGFSFSLHAGTMVNRISSTIGVRLNEFKTMASTFQEKTMFLTIESSRAGRCVPTRRGLPISVFWLCGWVLSAGSLMAQELRLNQIPTIG